MAFSASPLITAVIPTRGRPDSLLRTLQSIRMQTGVEPVELIVVDDASDPPLSLDCDDVAIIRFDRSKGACAARNTGAAAALGEYLLFMDDDAEFVSPNELQHALRWFEDRPQLAVVGFRQVTPAGDAHHAQPVASETPVRTSLFYSYGCLVRAHAYRKVGGMNEQFGYYYEEVELSLKLFAAGFDVVYDPNLKVVHHQDIRHRDIRDIQRKTTLNACQSYVLHYPAVLLPALFVKRLLLHAKLCGRRIPPLSDALWVVARLFGMRSYLRSKRRPYSRRIIHDFHAGCGKPMPLDAPNVFDR